MERGRVVRPRRDRRGGGEIPPAPLPPEGARTERAPIAHIVGEGPVCLAISRALARHDLADAARAVSWAAAADEASWACLRPDDAVVLVVAQGDVDAINRTSTPERHLVLTAGTTTALTAAKAAGSWPCVISSAAICGTRRDGSFIDDDEPIAVQPDTGFIGDLHVAAAAMALVDVPTCVLRPAAVVGGGVDSMTTRHFEAPRVLLVRGGAMRWQFVHVDDLADAVMLAWRRRLTGAMTLSAPGTLETEQLLRAARMRSLTVPAISALATAERLHRIGLLPSPATELEFVVYPWPVTSRRLREAGFEPRTDNMACFTEMLSDIRGRQSVVGRRLGGREAMAASAAGAAVAAIGTAALMRRGRRR